MIETADRRQVRPPGSAAPIELDAAEFRELGHSLVDRLADLIGGIRDRPVTPALTPSQARALLGADELPAHGSDPAALLDHAIELMIERSLFNGHPRFWGYITSSPAPLGVLAELLAAAVNQNVGAQDLSPLATEIEKQCIGWLAQLVGFPAGCGGILVSGGNMANCAALVTAQRAKAPWDLGAIGPDGGPPMRVYVSDEAHTWVQKAADLFGLGAGAIRWIPCLDDARMDVDALRARIEADLDAGELPFFVSATAGTVSTGAVDPLSAIAALCQQHDLWFHVDGAYGAPAAVVPELQSTFAGLDQADSVALDPHKWLYSPLEAGCVLVRDPAALPAAFSYRPEYYSFDGDPGDEPTNFYEYGLQNSRGFRALKVWLTIQQVGRSGYEQMIRDDIALAQAMAAATDDHPELEAVSCGLSIATFRYVPTGLALTGPDRDTYLDALNAALLDRIQKSGKAYLSGARVNGVFALRACVVNFRTTAADVDALPEMVAGLGRSLHQTRHPAP